MHESSRRTVRVWLTSEGYVYTVRTTTTRRYWQRYRYCTFAHVRPARPLPTALRVPSGGKEPVRPSGNAPAELQHAPAPHAARGCVSFPSRT
eukprot:29122-Pelagococcus_subviridis.AAC.7